MDIATTQARKATTARRDMMKTSEQSHCSAIHGLDSGEFCARNRSRASRQGCSRLIFAKTRNTVHTAVHTSKSMLLFDGRCRHPVCSMVFTGVSMCAAW